MAWQHWYRLLDKYNGDLQAATQSEVAMAQGFSENPSAEKREALEKYERIHRTTK